MQRNGADDIGNHIQALQFADGHVLLRASQRAAVMLAGGTQAIYIKHVQAVLTLGVLVSPMLRYQGNGAHEPSQQELLCLRGCDLPQQRCLTSLHSLVYVIQICRVSCQAGSRLSQVFLPAPQYKSDACLSARQFLFKW